MDEKARGEAVAESTKRLGEKSSRSEYPIAKQFYLYIFAKICYNKYRKAVEYDEIKI